MEPAVADLEHRNTPSILATNDFALPEEFTL